MSALYARDPVGADRYIQAEADNSVASGVLRAGALESDVVPEPSPSVVYNTLQKGEKSDDVVRLQTSLIAQGYLEGKADGDFGSKTETAIKAAQKAFGLEETGVADNAFQQRLYSEDKEETAAETDSSESEKTE